MLDRELVVTIAGTPAPKGSLRCIGGKNGRHQLIEDNARTKPWRETIVAACRRLFDPKGLEALGAISRGAAIVAADKGQPVGVEVTFAFRRPSNHYGTGAKTLNVVKASAPPFPTSRSVGDVDKLARLVLDALQDGPTPILADDAQVVELVARKVWADEDTARAQRLLGWDRLDHAGILLRIYPIR